MLTLFVEGLSCHPLLRVIFVHVTYKLSTQGDSETTVMSMHGVGYWQDVTSAADPNRGFGMVKSCARNAQAHELNKKESRDTVMCPSAKPHIYSRLTYARQWRLALPC